MRNRKGTWTADFRVNGKRYQKAILPVGLNQKKSLKEAEIEFEKLKTHLREGQLHLLSRADSFEKVADYYLEHYKLHGKPTENNQRIAASAVKVLKAYFGNRACHEITRFLVQKFEKERKEKGFLANRLIGTLKAIINRATDAEIIHDEENKIKKIHVKRGKPRETVIPPEHFEKMISVMNSERNRKCPDTELLKDCIRFMFLGAFRVREAINARWENVTENHYIVPAADSNPDDPRGTSKTKRHKKPLSPEMRKILERRQHKTGFIFSLDSGNTPIDYSCFSWQWQKARKACGFDEIGYQMKDLRRTSATLRYQKTRDIVAISKFLGHSTISMTSWYLQIDEDYTDGQNPDVDEYLNSVPNVVPFPIQKAQQKA